MRYEKIRVTFNMSSGESRATNLDVKDFEEAQKRFTTISFFKGH